MATEHTPLIQMLTRMSPFFNQYTKKIPIVDYVLKLKVIKRAICGIQSIRLEQKQTLHVQRHDVPLFSVFEMVIKHKPLMLMIT